MSILGRGLTGSLYTVPVGKQASAFINICNGIQSYQLGGATYDSVSYSVTSQDTFPIGLAFNNDGTKLYVLGFTNKTVFQYSLATAYDMSTASYDSVSFDVSDEDVNPYGIAFNDDGTKFYIVGNDNDTIFQYSLGTAFDMSTASYDSVSFSVASEDGTPYSLAFNNDGTKFYVLGYANSTIFQYSLSTPYDMSTASYDSVSFSVANEEIDPFGLAFNNDGTKFYIVGDSNDTIFQYSLGTAFDLNTASYDSIGFSIASEETIPLSLTFNGDGTKFYVIGSANDAVFQYSTGLASTTTKVYLRESGATGEPADSELALITRIEANDTFSSVAYALSAGESVYVEQVAGSAVFTVNGIEENE